ncbi:glycosyltransferase [Clostridium sp. CF012]|uniref:glycosyltransferase n=1 Tax=Clostridium sp. CF012 TaxID=2843319 RepID=UPI001C0E5EB8|nr:glycosyltransferase [Clostridium sp. CF012]MBU3142592.1 glycosyltransferase [Clostridium sp. CF012]
MIVQVGPYPEPIGGISIYIKRMKQYMDLLGMKNEVWDLNRIEKHKEKVLQVRLRYVPFKYLFRKDIQIIHYNLCGIRPKVYISIFNKIFFAKRKKIITVHGDCKETLKNNKRKLVKALNSFDAIICVKVGDAAQLESSGVTKPIYEVPAFLFPLKEGEGDIPEYILNFIESKDFVISANASSIQFHNDIDLYGIDMCIDLVIGLKKKGLNIGMVFCLPHVDNDVYYRKLMTSIDTNIIEDNFLFVHEQMELWPIIKKSDLFIRPTNYDGYGVSIAEAIQQSIPAIASDVCERPEGTIVFKSRDSKDLYNKTMDVIYNYNSYKNRIKDIQYEDNSKKILDIYDRIINT